MKRASFKYISFFASLSLGLCVAVYAQLCFSGEARNYRLWYYVPAAVLVGAFIADRIEQQRWKRGWCILWLDLVISSICLARPLIHWPPVSGHAAFGVYALLTCKDRYARLLAVLVLAITFYAKIYLWNGDVTLWTGLLFGGIASCAFSWIQK